MDQTGEQIPDSVRTRPDRGRRMSTVQSIDRAFAVLRSLTSGPAGVTEIADRVGLPKSTVSRLLSTLEELGAVEQVAAGGDYRVGWAMLELAAAARPGRSLVSVARQGFRPRQVIALTPEGRESEEPGLGLR